jgi:ribA/ribD-fused uncharacterized protein
MPRRRRAGASRDASFALMLSRPTRFGHAAGDDPDTGERFVFFWQSESPFSQWHPSPFEHRGERFVTAEQWMMAAKARLFGDHTVRDAILATSDPAEQKALGREVRGFDAERWSEHAFGVVYAGNALKFGAGSPLRQALFDTAGHTLVEASPYDRIWGIGLLASDERALRRAAWQGENRLGAALTALRDHMLAGEADARAAEYLARTGV